MSTSLRDGYWYETLPLDVRDKVLMEKRLIYEKSVQPIHKIINTLEVQSTLQVTLSSTDQVQTIERVYPKHVLDGLTTCKALMECVFNQVYYNRY